jgi:hypothetical protein
MVAVVTSKKEVILTPPAVRCWKLVWLKDLWKVRTFVVILCSVQCKTNMAAALNLYLAFCSMVIPTEPLEIKPATFGMEKCHKHITSYVWKHFFYIKELYTWRLRGTLKIQGYSKRSIHFQKCILQKLLTLNPCPVNGWKGNFSKFWYRWSEAARHWGCGSCYLWHAATSVGRAGLSIWHLELTSSTCKVWK